MDVKNLLRRRTSRPKDLSKFELKTKSTFKHSKRRAKKSKQKKWPLDTENGKLSYSRMVYKRNKKHYRIPPESLSLETSLQEAINHEKYPICGTNMGEITCC